MVATVAPGALIDVDLAGKRSGGFVTAGSGDEPVGNPVVAGLGDLLLAHSRSQRNGRPGRLAARSDGDGQQEEALRAVVRSQRRAPNFGRQRAGTALPFHTTVGRDCRTDCIPARSAANHRFVTGRFLLLRCWTTR